MIPKIEIATTDEIKSFQEQKLLELLAYINQNSPYYKRLFAKTAIDISKIKTLEDLQLLPVTSKEDLQKYNDDFLCVPVTKIIDYATTSGTLGEPVTFGLTDNDLERLAYNEAISFDCAGIKEGDVVQMMTTIDRRFMAGLAYFLGLRKMKVGVIRVGAGIPELQWDSILKYKPTHLITVPSFLLKLIEYAENNNIDYNKSSIKGAICIGESLRNQDFSMSVLSKKITDKWNIKLFSTYASTEMSTAFTECEHSIGGHHHPELIIIEVLDENNKPVKNGESGELTFTTIGVEAMPLVRFKTGDIVQLHDKPCACGRNTLRVGPVIGRKQQMIKYKGTTLYPPAMNDVLTHFENIENHIIEISTNDLGTDEILIKIAVKNKSEVFLQELKDHFRAKLRVTPKIEFTTKEILNPLIFNPMSRKPITFFDKRKNDY
ncbi:phenylacetate--CoA ligase [Flavobacterium psychrophilum]|uniref:Probable coenzyme F390 synthetase n=2 Tax=Flavobacteriaceae TaxID=49546 RepID=A6H1T5_FLAPJ|nr:phenylacetate--CoA ligase [Flavobacterium psychrophilum]AIG30979.1 phenylacetate--CoA ligase [Flavobacterium psychrophilum]AIG33256.1 phenylacetate--CoA ligase [Flavobacterium psychrophilum]AIG35405.1 phenylacetate--CoA ligase [Flavobacterium psychrophilum]AIG37766.1 phenylacetate--CoA ligase [Flavobacterium psychrophilum]AIG40037.1 phenylacetate--CoA ligase [Flavobacterium psychrophilum]